MVERKDRGYKCIPGGNGCFLRKAGVKVKMGEQGGGGEERWEK